MYTLITAASSAQAHQLKNKLKTEHILLGDHLELPAFMLRSAQMLHLPDPASAAYAHEMLTLALDREISLIYPLRDEELQLLNEAKLLFSEYEIEIADIN